MPFKQDQPRKNPSVMRSLSSAKMLWELHRPSILTATVLMMLTVSLAAKVPECAVPSELRFALIAVHLIAAYVMVAVLAM